MNALFLGGDLRQKYACDYLCKNNILSEYHESFELDEYIINKIKNASIVVLPIPITKDDINLNTVSSCIIKLSDIIPLINIDSIIFGGIFSKILKKQLEEMNQKYVDLFDIEEFQIKNALLSAEGAIYYAKQHLDKSIYGSEIAVLGFGRIGKILSYLLYSQGAKITVCARKDKDYTWSKLIGFNGFKIKTDGNKNNLSMIDNRFDIVFNTIPYRVLDEEFVEKLNTDTIIIDLASRPFGIDDSLVKKYKLKYYRELGIPGRYAPMSAGEIIGKTIINNLLIKED